MHQSMTLETYFKTERLSVFFSITFIQFTILFTITRRLTLNKNYAHDTYFRLCSIQCMTKKKNKSHTDK